MENENASFINDAEKLIKSFTPEHWLTCHLLYSIFLRRLIEMGVIGANHPQIREYFRYVVEAINDHYNGAPKQAFLISLFQANQSLIEDVQNAYTSDDEEENPLGGIMDYMLRQIIVKSVDLIGNSKFKKCFKDIFFNKDGSASSPKAQIAVHGLMGNAPQDLKDKWFNILKNKENKNVVSNSNSDIGNTDPAFENRSEDNTEIGMELDNMGIHDMETDELESNDMESNDMESNDMESEEEYVPGWHPYIKSWNKVKDTLSELEYEHLLLFHGISLVLCYKFLRRDWYGQYQRSVIKAISRLKGNNGLRLRKQELAYANNSFIQLKEDVMDYIFNSHDYRVVALKNDLFTLATDICLNLVSNSFSKEKTLELLKQVRASNDTISLSPEVESYAFTFYLCADSQYQDMYGKKIEDLYLDDYWTDYEDDDTKRYNNRYGNYGGYMAEYYDEYDDEEETDEELECSENGENESKSEKQKGDLISQELENSILEFDIEKDLLLHCISLKIMSKVLKPRIYCNYLKAVRKLMMSYHKNKDRSILYQPFISKARKNTDELFLSRYKFLCKNINFNIPIGKIDDFNLVSKAMLICQSTIRKKSQESCLELLKELTYNEIVQEYVGTKSEYAAQRCLEFATIEIKKEEENL